MEATGQSSKTPIFSMPHYHESGGSDTKYSWVYYCRNRQHPMPHVFEKEAQKAAMRANRQLIGHGLSLYEIDEEDPKHFRTIVFQSMDYRCTYSSLDRAQKHPRRIRDCALILMLRGYIVRTASHPQKKVAELIAASVAADFMYHDLETQKINDAFFPPTPKPSKEGGEARRRKYGRAAERYEKLAELEWNRDPSLKCKPVARKISDLLEQEFQESPQQFYENWGILRPVRFETIERRIAHLNPNRRQQRQ